MSWKHTSSLLVTGLLNYSIYTKNEWVEAALGFTCRFKRLHSLYSRSNTSPQILISYVQFNSVTVTHLSVTFWCYILAECDRDAFDKVDCNLIFLMHTKGRRHCMSSQLLQVTGRPVRAVVEPVLDFLEEQFHKRYKRKKHFNTQRPESRKKIGERDKMPVFTCSSI